MHSLSFMKWFKVVTINILSHVINGVNISDNSCYHYVDYSNDYLKADNIGTSKLIILVLETTKQNYIVT